MTLVWSCVSERNTCGDCTSVASVGATTVSTSVTARCLCACAVYPVMSAGVPSSSVTVTSGASSSPWLVLWFAGSDISINHAACKFWVQSCLPVQNVCPAGPFVGRDVVLPLDADGNPQLVVARP